MTIVYNIEKFVVEQMLKPHQDLLVLGNENYKEAVKLLRKNPDEIIRVLENNKKARELVFNRLAQTNFKFYKWLKHPVVEYVEMGICTAKMIADRAENER